MSTTMRGASAAGAAHPFFSRLRHYTGLRNELFEAFDAIDEGVDEFRKNQHVWDAGARPEQAMLLESGWAYHYRDVEDGDRQICQILLPGDVLDGAAILPGGRSMTAVCAAVPITVRRLNTKKLLSLLSNNPQIAAAFWWTVVQTDNIFREHIIRVGRLNSAESLAHLLLELTVRSEMADLTGEDGAVTIPITQSHMADYLGITPVHVSRMMGLLRAGEFLTYEKSQLRILKREGMEQFGDFDPAYLKVGCEDRSGWAEAS